MEFMINYEDLYELLRKEKYSEQLQVLPKDFLASIKDFFDTQKKLVSSSIDSFSDSSLREKKQYENSRALFNELMLRRRKKILSLVFVAAETGVMKKDITNMFQIEQELFEKLVKDVEESEGKLKNVINGVSEKKQVYDKMIIFKEDVDEIVDMKGNTIGPFRKGMLANVDLEVAEILVDESKASFVDA